MKLATTVLLSILISTINYAQDITVNQLGYLPGEIKLATVPAEYSGVFKIIDATTEEIKYTGTISEAGTWSPSGTEVRLADFTAFTKPGVYKITTEGSTASSHEFEISPYIYDELVRTSMRFFYLSRVSMPLEEQYAGEYARAAGHPDDEVIIHASAASAARPEGTTISTPRGWYDAGDYNKYVVNAGISNYTVFAIAEHFPEFAENLDLNIPESENGVPDLIDEAVYNLRWMLSMQDPNDGGVYHKCTHKNFLGFISPSAAALQDRYVVMKTTTATLDMAAVAAQAYRILSDYSTAYPGLADSCLTAAKAAYSWAQANPTVYYAQPSDISTGSYGDGNAVDEFRWAAMELYVSTGEASYLSDYNYLGANAGVPSWGSVYSLGLISLYRNADIITNDADIEEVKTKILALADNLHEDLKESAYGVPATVFNWGSNSHVANSALMSLQAYDINKDPKYMETVITAMDYLLGRNPTKYSFVTGFGDHSPMDPHDRKSASDGVAAPIPGMLVGGPNPGNTDDCGSSAYPSTFPALSYIDDQCSYSTNEITINWNAPLAYVTAGIIANLQPTPLKAYTGSTDSSQIILDFDLALDTTNLTAVDFSVTANNGEELPISGVESNEADQLIFLMSSTISKFDKQIKISYTPGNLSSLYGTVVDTFLNFPVINLVYGSAPEVTHAYTDETQNIIYLEFSKKMLDPSVVVDSFIIQKNQDTLSLSKASLSENDSMQVILESTSKLSYRDTLSFTYLPSFYGSADGGILDTVLNFPIQNRLPGPPVFTNATLSPSGTSILLSFSKPLADTSLVTEDFSMIYNDSSVLVINGIALDEEVSSSIVIDLATQLTPSDSNIYLLYTAGSLLSSEGVPVESFGPVLIENTAAQAHPIPGLIEAEDYLVNQGYIFEECTDEGGGQNLGYADAGDYIDYFVNVASTGEFTIIYRVASDLTASEFELSSDVNGVIHSYQVPYTGGWQAWQNEYQLVNLVEGEQIFTISTLAPAYNLNWFRVESGNTIPVDYFQHIEYEEELVIYPMPAKAGSLLNLKLSNAQPGKIVVEITDITGRNRKQLYSGQVNQVAGELQLDTREAGLSSGIYILTVKSSGTTSQKVISLY